MNSSLGFVIAGIVAGSWRPGIGDPTPLGWATAVAYLVGAVACAWASRRERRAGTGGAATWLVLAALMAALGVNKQLDLQTAFTAAGRRLAKAQGWYEQRRAYQAAFIAVVAGAGLLALAVLGWFTRRHWRRQGFALLGVVLLVVFVVIRASSFHRVDQMLGARLGTLRLNHVLELGGIACVGLGALLGAIGVPGSRTEGSLVRDGA
jgi:heme/copper-type cytochrome/quinol oxidase subunit 3